jgi:hypothetical protein
MFTFTRAAQIVKGKTEFSAMKKCRERERERSSFPEGGNEVKRNCSDKKRITFLFSLVCCSRVDGKSIRRVRKSSRTTSLTTDSNELTLNLKQKKMNSQIKAFMDIPKIYRTSSLSSCAATSDSIEDLYFDITSFDDSCIPNHRRHDSVRNFDTSSDISVDYSSSKSSQTSSNESDNMNLNVPKQKKNRHYKPLMTVIKILKNFSIKDGGSKTAREPKNNIFRQPRVSREYTYIKGISGIAIRVEKASSPITTAAQNSCHRCHIRNG